jgi:hypothetical protein
MTNTNPERFCVVCGTKFRPRKMVSTTCSAKCYDKGQYITGKKTTDGNYKYISGNWARYYSRLLSLYNRRKYMVVEELLDLHEKQRGKCAMTGQELTCHLKKGEKCWTNASIDRIDPGKGYEIGNVQLVCSAVNMFRGNLTTEEFVLWCNRVTEHMEKKDG